MFGNNGNHKKCIAMFVDIVDSTKMKYVYNDGTTLSLLELFVELIDVVVKKCSRESEGSEIDILASKFTGDGVILVYEASTDAFVTVLRIATNVIQSIDILNMNKIDKHPPGHKLKKSNGDKKKEYPRLQVRIGIATDEYVKLPVGPYFRDVVGRGIDLAARLCAEADKDTILVDKATKDGYCSALKIEDDERFKKCNHRLMLKGIPNLEFKDKEEFFYFSPLRLVKKSVEGQFSGGILKLYTDRNSLDEDFVKSKTLFDLAVDGSTILVAGRTLYAWIKILNENIDKIRSKKLNFNFLISSINACNNYLIENQIQDVREHKPEVEKAFEKIKKEIPGKISLQETEHLFLDGCTCAEIFLPHETGFQGSDKKKIILQDINAAKGRKKATLLFVCTCSEEEGNGVCMACGLRNRVEHIFKNPLSLKDILWEHDIGLGIRNNRPTNYLHMVTGYFRCINEKNSFIPAPICVQIQVASRCSTKCNMCDHWNNNRDELGVDEWLPIFEQIKNAGVKTVIFSGGEPLMRGTELIKLLKAAKGKNLRIGLLTNGTMAVESPAERERMISSIAESVDWVTISVDGIPDIDKKIRKCDINRSELLKEFCDKLLSKNHSLKVWATVTLQKENINMNLEKVCRFINQQLGIPQVNFKIATGAKEILERPPNYLISEENIQRLINNLEENDLVNNEGNQLFYLKRCFEHDIFNPKDTANGVPVLSFYKKRKLRCFTPYLFSLIDSNGDVYPCCYLYRDNHTNDPKSNRFQEIHVMGNLRNERFIDIWHGSKYIKERERLCHIDPEHEDFLPCGECTRHYLHNFLLSKVYDAYVYRLDKLEAEIKKMGRKEEFVFF